VIRFIEHLYPHLVTTSKYMSLAGLHTVNIIRDLINALPGNSSVNTVQHATIDEAVFSVSFGPSSGAMEQRGYATRF
jgi:hypothetical protein